MPSDDVKDVPPEGELLRTLAHRVSAMVAYFDSGLRCRFANRAHERWLGVAPEALIGKHISEVLGPLYLPNLPHIEGALRGESREFEREIPDPSGGPPRHSLTNYIPDLADGAVRGFFSLVGDVSGLKRTELALRESEERFRLTLDEAPIGMALVSLDGRFTRVNRALCEIVGYERDELEGLTFQTITHPQDVAVDVANAGRLSRGEISRYQTGKRYIRKDGTVVDVMLHVSVIRGHDGKPAYFVSQMEDVTRRKRLEDQLRFAEARSSGILSISADAIISIDEHQRITMFNEGAEKIFGYSRAEAIGAPLDLLIPARLGDIHRRHVEAFAEGKTVARQMGERGASILGLRKNGQEFPASAAISRLEVGGRRVLTVALRDVTEQKRFEGEQRFLAEVGPMLATTLDFEETLTRIASLAVREIGDLCIVEVVEDGDQSRQLKVASKDPSRAGLCDVLTRGSPEGGRPYLMRSVLESRRSVLVRRVSAATIASLAQSEEQRQALRDAHLQSLVAVPLVARSRLLGALVLLSSTPSRVYGPADVKLAEELAQRAALSIENASLYATARRATKARDDILGIVAHDLRNPVSSILAQASLLRRRAAPEDRSRKSAESIERAALRMNRLIQDLLDVTRMEAGRLSVDSRRVSTVRVLSDSVDAQKSLAAPGALELRVEARPDLPDVWADRDRLLQIFENLIGNSLKFTRPGGRITVGARALDGEVLFWVTDTGSGISAEDRPHLFDRFWQGRRGVRRRGAGLGLPIVKGLVEAHHGRIWVESTPGEGSTFLFTIPALVAEVEWGHDHA